MAEQRDYKSTAHEAEAGANHIASAQKAASEGGRRAGTYAASNSISQLIRSGGEAVNQNLLYGADSHQAEVQQKLDELEKALPNRRGFNLQVQQLV